MIKKKVRKRAAEKLLIEESYNKRSLLYWIIAFVILTAIALVWGTSTGGWQLWKNGL